MLSKKLTQLLRQKKISKVKLADYLGMSPQSLSNKFFRNSFSVHDLVEILDYLDCELVIVSKPDIKITITPDD